MSAPRKLDPKLQSMLHELAKAPQAPPDMPSEPYSEKTKALRDAWRRIQRTEPRQFRAGDLVRWQPGLKNCLWPLYGEAAVVVECIDPPLLSDHPSADSPYFRESLSIVLGLQREGGFHCWHYDGRRFERA